MTQLPTLLGTALDGQSIMLPKDLPPMEVVALIGFTHQARVDVQHWKRVLDAAGVPWISLPTSPADIDPAAMAPILAAMKPHVAESLWSRTIQIHAGGGGLLQTFGWEVNDVAKVVLVDPDGTVNWSHGGPYSEGAWESLQTVLDK